MVYKNNGKGRDLDGVSKDIIQDNLSNEGATIQNFAGCCLSSLRIKKHLTAIKYE